MMGLERPGGGGGEEGSRVVSKEPQVTVLHHGPEDHGKGGLHPKSAPPQWVALGPTQQLMDMWRVARKSQS